MLFGISLYLHIPQRLATLIDCNFVFLDVHIGLQKRNIDYISIIETFFSYLSLEYARCEINPHLSPLEVTQKSIQDCDTTPSNDRCHEKVCIYK